MDRRNIYYINILVLLISLISKTVFAQENVGDDSTVRYPADYFAEWSPVTAQDMLDRIPGMDSSGGFGPPGGGGGGFSGGFGGGGPPPGFFGRGGGGGPRGGTGGNSPAANTAVRPGSAVADGMASTLVAAAQPSRGGQAVVLQSPAMRANV